MQQTKVLVTGALGVIGRAVVERLAALAGANMDARSPAQPLAKPVATIKPALSLKQPGLGKLSHKSAPGKYKAAALSTLDLSEF